MSKNQWGFTPGGHGNYCSSHRDPLGGDTFLQGQENVSKCNYRFQKACGREEEVSEVQELLQNGFNKKDIEVCFKGYH